MVQILERRETLEDVIHTVQRRFDTLKPVDVDVNLPNFAFDPRGKMPVLAGPSGNQFHLNKRAQMQFCSRLGIPYEFFAKKCDEAMQAFIANKLLAKGDFRPTVGRVRTIQGDVARAILSQGYNPIDDIDIFPLLAEVLAEEPDLDVQFSRFDDEYTHVRILFPRTQMEVKKGDIVQTGIHISNSEVGLRSVHIDGLIYRLVCLNGLVTGGKDHSISIVHRTDKDRAIQYIKDTIDSLRPKIQIMMDRFKASVNEMPRDPMKTLEATGKLLTKGQLDSVRESFLQQMDESVFGIINAFTAAAQKQETAEARYQMERTGGKLLRIEW